MYRFLFALVLCLSLGAPWEALAQGGESSLLYVPPSMTVADGSSAGRDALLAPPPPAAQPAATPATTIVVNVPPAGTSPTAVAAAADPWMPSTIVDEVPTPPPSAESEPWWLLLLKNGDLWAMVIVAFFGILKLFGVKNVEKKERDFATAVGVAYHATEEAGLRGEIKKGAKAAPFGDIFARLMTGKGHTVSLESAKLAQAEADALNNLARKEAEKVAALSSPTPAPSAPSR